jgi:hypothetical protein
MLLGFGFDKKGLLLRFCVWFFFSFAHFLMCLLVSRQSGSWPMALMGFKWPLLAFVRVAP